MKGRAARKRPKFVIYFQLLEAFNQPGCPICRILTEQAEKAIDALLYEQVNDPATRHRIAASHGFCNWHTWMIPRIRNCATGTAIIYRHLLQNALARLTKAGPPAGARSVGGWLSRRQELPPFVDWHRNKTPCFLCTSARKSERNALACVLDSIGEPAFADALGRSEGLCVTHLAFAMELGHRHRHLEPLVTIHAKLWRDLESDLGEFVRKADYRHADEPLGSEGGSWARALGLFAGSPGLFGADERGREPARAATTEDEPGQA